MRTKINVWKSCYRDTKLFFCFAVLLVTLSDRTKDHHGHPENYLPSSWLTGITDVLSKITLATNPLYECHLEWLYTLSCLISVTEIWLVNLSSHVWWLFCFQPFGQIFFIELLFIAARGREDSIYDTFVPNQTNGLQQQQLIELQQRVKAGSLTVDWQRVQKGMDGVQQVGLSHTAISLTLDLEWIGPNPNKTRTICCSCCAKLQNNLLTVEHEGTRYHRVKEMAIYDNISLAPNVWTAPQRGEIVMKGHLSLLVLHTLLSQYKKG